MAMSLLFAACDALVVIEARNDSDSALVVVITELPGGGREVELPPRSAGLVYSGIGSSWHGEVVVLTETCAVLWTRIVDVKPDAGIVIESSGAISWMDRAPRQAGQGWPSHLEPTTRCQVIPATRDIAQR